MLFVEIMRTLLIHKGAVPQVKLVILPVPWLTFDQFGVRTEKIKPQLKVEFPLETNWPGA